jgi:hypothetical protein
VIVKLEHFYVPVAAALATIECYAAIKAIVIISRNQIEL